MHPYQITPGMAIKFGYRAPRTGPRIRFGVVESRFRSKAGKLTFRVLDHSAMGGPDFRDFHYEKMEDVKVGIEIIQAGK